MPVTDIGMDTIYVRHKGFFDFNKLLREIKGWFASNYFKHGESKHKYKAADREVEFWGEIKINDYVRYRMDVSVKVWDMKDVEVIRDGQKSASNEGRLQVVINGKAQLDWIKRFGGSKFLQGVHDFYQKFIVHRSIERQWVGPLVGKMYSLQKTIKDSIGFEV